jgi:serine acetyltransferase
MKDAFNGFFQAVRADRQQLSGFQQRYNQDRATIEGGAVRLIADLVTRVGFQMMVAIRVMHLVHRVGIPFGGAVVSRLIRHLYGAEIHWEASIAPGIVIVHGNGLVIGRRASVGSGCLLFQGVTLGESRDPVSGEHGAPTLGRNVHVMPNAVLTGPISVGDNSKVQANVLLSRSVPESTSVCNPDPLLVPRASRTSGSEQP